jgi:hypothetical protein
MINATGCRAKSFPSGGAIVPVQGHTCRCRREPGSPLCSGVAKGAAPVSRVGGGGRGGEAGLWHGHCRHRAGRNMTEGIFSVLSVLGCFSQFTYDPNLLLYF